MAYTEKRGGTWRVRFRGPDGSWLSASTDDHGERFRTQREALEYGLAQEADIRRKRWRDPRDEPDPITLRQWVNEWWAGLDLEISTTTNYRFLLQGHILDPLGDLYLHEITPAEVNRWERSIVRARYSERTAQDARNVLHNALNDAIRAGLITSNPATRPRGKGRKGERRIKHLLQRMKVWPSPLDALLIAERVAVLSGSWHDFVLVLTAAYTGLRWSELMALTPESVAKPGLIFAHWKLYEHSTEVDGKTISGWYWGRPKDGSIRDIHVPMWLWEMLAAVAGEAARCACDRSNPEPWCRGRVVLFRSGSGYHHRRSNFARRLLRPAADGRYVRRGDDEESAARGLPVLADGLAHWVGEPLTPWPVPVPGEPYEPPRPRRLRRTGQRWPVNSASSRDALIAYAISQGMSPEVARDMTREALLDRYVRAPEHGLVCWVPIRPGLTAHGCRHGHQTWLQDHRVNPVYSTYRMGHLDTSMTGLYSHVTEGMIEHCLDVLDDLWRISLAERADLDPRSPVPPLDAALRNYREGTVTPLRRGHVSQKSPKTRRGHLPRPVGMPADLRGRYWDRTSDLFGVNEE